MGGLYASGNTGTSTFRGVERVDTFRVNGRLKIGSCRFGCSSSDAGFRIKETRHALTSRQDQKEGKTHNSRTAQWR